MADVDTIICIGSSNMAGSESNLYDIPAIDFFRWTTTNTPTPVSPGRPYDRKIHGVRMWTPRRPYSLNSQRAVTAATTTTVTYGGAVISAPTPTADMWVFILRGFGRGNLRRVVSHVGQTITVTPALSPSLNPRIFSSTNAGELFTSTAHGLTLNTQITFALNGGTLSNPIVVGTVYYAISITTDTFQVSLTPSGAAVVLTTDSTGSPTFSRVGVDADTLVVLQDSHTIASVSVDGLVVTKVSATSPNFTAADVGRFALFHAAFPPGAPGEFNVTRKVIAQTNDTITLEHSLGAPFPGAGTGFQVLAGVNANPSITTMQPPNAVLQDLTFYLDEIAPCLLTGLDYCNFDAGTPFVAPRIQSFDPTSTCIAELTWQLRAKFAAPMVVLQMGVNGATISPFPADSVAFGNVVGPLHDIIGLDFHPSTVPGIYTVVTSAITSMRALIEAEGHKMKVRGIFINLFDNDPNLAVGGQVERVNRLRANTVLLRDALRTAIGDQTVLFIMAGPSVYGLGVGVDYRPQVYEDLRKIAAADPYSAVFDTRTGYAKAPDGVHYSAVGQIQLGKDFFRAWESIHDRLVEDTTAANDFALEVSNMALSYVGKGTRVFSLDVAVDQSAEAALCAQFYPIAFKDAQERHNWAFSTRTAALVAMTKDELRTDWAFAYMLPGDMSSPIEVMRPGFVNTAEEVPPWLLDPSIAQSSTASPPPFAVEKNEAGERVLYTDVENANLRYSVKLNSQTTVPNNFKIAVASKLAAQIVGSIVQGEAGMEAMRRFEGMARLTIEEAAATDANKQQHKAPPNRMPWNRF